MFFCRIARRHSRPHRHFLTFSGTIYWLFHLQIFFHCYIPLSRFSLLPQLKQTNHPHRIFISTAIAYIGQIVHTNIFAPKTRWVYLFTPFPPPWGSLLSPRISWGFSTSQPTQCLSLSIKTCVDYSRFHHKQS